MGEVVNLRRARKLKQRDAEDQNAAANRLIHGQGKSQRQAIIDGKARETRALDGHRLETSRDDS